LPPTTLDPDAGMLGERLNARVLIPGNPEADQSARGFGLDHADATAAARQPGRPQCPRRDWSSALETVQSHLSVI
jgi:hypothetical protein